MYRLYRLVAIAVLLTVVVGCNLTDSAVAPGGADGATMAGGDAEAASDASSDAGQPSDVNEVPDGHAADTTEGVDTDESSDTSERTDTVGEDANADDAGPDAEVDASAQDSGSDTGSCQPPRQSCGSDCVDLSGDPQHCGGCDHACAAPDHAAVSACESSQCVFECMSGWFDLDGDLQAADTNGCEADCQPTNGGVELCIDGVDNDCNGTVDDGCDCNSGDTRPCGSDVGECQMGVQKCQDGQFGACEDAVEPSQEVCDFNDNDCDGEVDEGVQTTYYPDEDGDGYGDSSLGYSGCLFEIGNVTTGGDCNDENADIHPGAAEACVLSVDRDCDGKKRCSDPDCDGKSCSINSHATCNNGACLGTIGCANGCQQGYYCTCNGTQCCPDRQLCACR